MDENADNSNIFLTLEEAERAICIDFRQYAPQTLLFSGILPLISDNTVFLERAPGKTGAWINRAGQLNMHWLEGPDLIEYMCRAVSDASWDPDLAAQVCSRVFQTRSTPVPAGEGQAAGVSIHTNMEDFSCHQCGRCCRRLDYRDALTSDDVSRWRALDRRDILEWVEIVRHKDGGERYRMWANPKTGLPAEICPFLEKCPTAEKWICRIQNAKPGICRQYPTSRKHALMTGCLGFSS